MAKILETTPKNFETDVIRNVFFKVRLDEALDRSSITDSTVILVEKNTEETVQGVPDYIPGTNTVTFQLFDYLKKYTEYLLIVVGGNSGIQTLMGKNWNDRSFTLYFTTGDAIDNTIALASHALASHLTYSDGPYWSGNDGVYKQTFSRTGEPVSHIVTTAATIGPSGNIIPIPHGADLYLEPSGAAAGEVLSVLSTRPVHLETNVEFESIDVTFSHSLNPDSIDGNIVFEAEEISGDIGYPVEFTTSLADNVLNIALVDPSTLSTTYTITLKGGLMAIDMVLGQNYVFSFSTPIYPLFCSVNSIKRHMGDLISNISDHDIKMVIYINSKYILSVAKTPWAINNPTPLSAEKYTCCKTEYDLLNRAYLSGGPVISKKLADFEVSYGRGFMDVVKKKLDALEDCIEENFNMIHTGSPFVDVATISKSEYDIRRPSWKRLEDPIFTKFIDMNKRYA